MRLYQHNRHICDMRGLALNVRLTPASGSGEAPRASPESLAPPGEKILIPALLARADFALALSMRGPVCTPNHRGQGRRPGPCPVGMGQEAFDSFARPLETGVCNCELAVMPGGPAWTGVPSDGSGASEDFSGVIRGTPSPRARDREPKIAATGRRKAH